MAARESAEVKAAVADVVAGKLTRQGAAEAYGVSESSIYRAMQRHELGRVKRKPRAPRGQPLPEPYHFADGTPLTI